MDKVTKEEMLQRFNRLTKVDMRYLVSESHEETFMKIDNAIRSLIERYGDREEPEPSGEAGELVYMLDKMARPYIQNAADEEWQERAEKAVAQLKSLLRPKTVTHYDVYSVVMLMAARRLNKDKAKDLIEWLQKHGIQVSEKAGEKNEED